MLNLLHQYKHIPVNNKRIPRRHYEASATCLHDEGMLKKTSIQVSFLWLCIAEVYTGNKIQQEVSTSGRGEDEQLDNGVGMGGEENSRGLQQGKVWRWVRVVNY
jgi:hypothetical protein